MNTIVRDTPVKKPVSVWNTGHGATQPIKESTVVSGASVETPAKAAQDFIDIPDYRWNRELIDPPIEVLLYHAGEYVDTGKICTIGLHGMFVETTGAFAKDMYGQYVQVQFKVLGDNKNSRFCLDGRISHSFDTGVVVLMDVLCPVTCKGLKALMEQVTTSHRRITLMAPPIFNDELFN